MNPAPGGVDSQVAVVLITLAAASAVGLWWRLRTGRVRVGPARIGRGRTGQARTGPARTPGAPSAALAALAAPDARATFVQFSAPACAPCRATHRLLTELVAADPAVGYLQLDAQEHLDLAAAARVRRTPTVLLLDRAGAEVARVSGLPRRAELTAALAAVGADPVA